MKTDFYKTYEAGCSGNYPNDENLMLHRCCEHCQVIGTTGELWPRVKNGKS